MDLNEARKNLESCLGDETRKEYFAILRQWFLFKDPITKEDFDKNVRKILINPEQIRCHNNFLLAILSKISCNTRMKSIRSTNEKGVFEYVDFADYVPPSSPSMVPPSGYEIRSAAAELFMPDGGENGFIACRIAVTAWENGIKGADDGVTELMVHACQVFVKNIITAMISRMKGYKIRDGKLQYGFNMPIPDPFRRNYNNILDTTQDSKSSNVSNAVSDVTSAFAVIVSSVLLGGPAFQVPPSTPPTTPTSLLCLEVSRLHYHRPVRYSHLRPSDNPVPTSRHDFLHVLRKNVLFLRPKHQYV